MLLAGKKKLRNAFLIFDIVYAAVQIDYVLIRRASEVKKAIAEQLGKEIIWLPCRHLFFKVVLATATDYFLLDNKSLEIAIFTLKCNVILL